MSVNVKKTRKPDDVDITCDRCGGPITKTTAMGMSCENDCYKQDNEEAKKLLEGMFGSVFKDKYSDR